MLPDVGRPDVERPDVERPGVDQPGKAAKRDTESTAVSRRQTLSPMVLSGAVTSEALQEGGVLERAAAGEASDQNDPYDYDSDNTSDGEDPIAGAPRTLQQKKQTRLQRLEAYMRVRRASPLVGMDPRGGTRRLIAQLRNTPGV